MAGHDPGFEQLAQVVTGMGMLQNGPQAPSPLNLALTDYITRLFGRVWFIDRAQVAYRAWWQLLGASFSLSIGCLGKAIGAGSRNDHAGCTALYGWQKFSDIR